MLWWCACYATQPLNFTKVLLKPPHLPMKWENLHEIENYSLKSNSVSICTITFKCMLFFYQIHNFKATVISWDSSTCRYDICDAFVNKHFGIHHLWELILSNIETRTDSRITILYTVIALYQQVYDLHDYNSCMCNTVLCIIIKVTLFVDMFFV